MSLRQLHLPPKDRPYWLPTPQSGFELNYLSWGYRWYGVAPIAPSLHEGWHYFVVLEGTPTLLVQGRSLRLRPGTVCIAHPDCPVGHRDLPKRRCRILTWIWRTPPNHTALHAPDAGFIRLQLASGQIRRLESFHGECRKAVAMADERSMLILHGARIQKDLCLLEARDHSAAADGEFRFNLAVEYIRKNLTEEKLIKALCEYLQISEASLKRLFHERAKKSPRDFILDRKMEFATTQLSTGSTAVKAVAYALGYKHANDFSRAFKRHQGFEASRLQSRPSGPAAMPRRAD
jgi:AraC-like DNA-binding protein